MCNNHTFCTVYVATWGSDHQMCSEGEACVFFFHAFKSFIFVRPCVISHISVPALFDVDSFPSFPPDAEKSASALLFLASSDWPPLPNNWWHIISDNLTFTHAKSTIYTDTQTNISWVYQPSGFLREDPITFATIQDLKACLRLGQHFLRRVILWSVGSG